MQNKIDMITKISSTRSQSWQNIYIKSFTTNVYSYVLYTKEPQCISELHIRSSKRNQNKFPDDISLTSQAVITTQPKIYGRAQI